MKKAIKIGGGLFALLIIVAVVSYMFLGSIIKTSVESFGPDLTKGEVKLESASLSVLGTGGVKGMEIGNPKNGDFSSPFAFKLGEAYVSVNVGSITSEKIVVNEISIDGAELCWEGLTGTNHQKILENIEAHVGPSEETDEKPADEEGTHKSLEVKLFKMTNTKIHLYAVGSKLAEITLPDFEKEGIGSGGDVEASETIGLIYEAMLGSITELLNDSKDILGDAWTGLSEAGGKAVDSIKEGAGDVVDGIKDGAEGVVDGIKGLFDKK